MNSFWKLSLLERKQISAKKKWKVPLKGLSTHYEPHNIVASIHDCGRSVARVVSIKINERKLFG